MINKINEGIMDGLSTIGQDTSSKNKGATINVNKRDLGDATVQKSLAKMKDTEVNIVETEAEAPKKLTYLSNILDEDGSVSKPFTIKGKNYQMVRAHDQYNERVNAVYCIDETDENGENLILSQDHFENSYVDKSEVEEPAPKLTTEKKEVESETPKSLNLGSYKHFFVNTKNGKVRKMKTAEELANATKTPDEKYMGLSEFRKHVNGTLFGSKKKEEISEDQTETDLHAKALKLMTMIQSKVPENIIASVKTNPKAQREVVEAFAEMIGVPRNMLSKLITNVKSAVKAATDPKPTATATDGGGLAFEGITSKPVLKTIKVKDLKNIK